MSIFAQPLLLDIAICIFVFIFSLFGMKNGFIKEFQKCLNVFISILLSKFIVSYVMSENLYLNKIYYLFIFVGLIFLIGFIIDSILYNIDVIKIDNNTNKLGGLLLGTCKSFLIISILFLGLQIIPLDSGTKDKISAKAEKSYLYVFSKKIQYFMLGKSIIE